MFMNVYDSPTTILTSVWLGSGGANDQSSSALALGVESASAAHSSGWFAQSSMEIHRS